MGTQNETNGKMNGPVVISRTSQGMDIHGKLARLSRHAVVFEMSNPNLALRISEVLNEFEISANDRVLYSGRAVIRSVVNTRTTITCEAALSEHSWTDVAGWPSNGSAGNYLRDEFNEFVRDWQKLYRVIPEYKVIMADIQTFLADLRLWLDQVELGIQSSNPSDREKLETEIGHQLRGQVISALTNIFEQFETIGDRIEPDMAPAHRAFGQRQLHPYLLCAPVVYRTYTKPLGYAGDYEMMNMILRNGLEGPSLYAKLVNSYVLDLPPARAVRNRVDFLTEKIIQETLRVTRSGKLARIYNLACGPAREVQNFLADSTLADRSEFDVLDFNQETVQYAGQQLEHVKRKHSRNTAIKISKKSVHHILKEKEKHAEGEPTYDLIYCSGLYDYLSDRVCKSLNTYLYDRLSPGGLLVIGNFAPSTPVQIFMSHFLEWFLIYRNRNQLTSLAPDEAPRDCCTVIAEPTGANLFLEVRKPK